ncbi:hypothetical protein K1T71_015075 [Dendrolimus kikuchii]|nr:hypothetical protein K1T71_015075 [Dendrolimus kikuchii]
MQFGKFLLNSNVGKITQQGVKNVGRNRISVEFTSPQDANNFVNNPVLLTANYKPSIPTFNVTRMGVVRDVPVDWSMEEFVLQSDIPLGFGHILKARRFNRKVRNQDGSTEWCPSTTVVLTFYGQALPKHIYCCYTSLLIDPYVLPTIQCFSCCRFGHVKDKCRSKPRCFKCGQMHTGNSCSITPDNAYCCLCTGQHFATDKSCPEFHRQKCIKKKMSDDNVSYSEAATLFPPCARSFSDITRTMFSSAQTFTPHIITSRPSKDLTSPTSPRSPQSTSYRRTVYSSPKPRAPLATGYDRFAHQALINHYNPPPPQNGAAFLNNQNNGDGNDNLLDGLLTMLINIISKFDDHQAPSNVASKLTQLFNIINKIQPYPME